jgi:hypothetical protein
MAAKKASKKATKTAITAAKEAIGEAATLAKIAAPPWSAMGERLHSHLA